VEKFQWTTEEKMVLLQFASYLKEGLLENTLQEVAPLAIGPNTCSTGN